MNPLLPNFCAARLRLLAVLLLAALLASAVHPAVAEPPTPQDAALGLEQSGVTITWDEQTGTPSFVTGLPAPADLGALADLPAEQRARAFLAEYAGLYRLRDQAAELVTQSVSQDELGMEHVRFSQVLNGVPVFGGELKAHFRGQQLTALHGKFFPQLDVTTTPSLDQAAALAIVLADLGDPQGELRADRSGLVIYVDKRTPHLTWKLNVYSEQNLGNWLYFVDAGNGLIVHKLNQMDTAKSLVVYTANNGSTLPGTLVCTYPTCTSGDLDVQGAYTNTSKTYDYYSQVFGRDSYNGLGGQLKSTVHYKSGYKNAFWSGVQMVFGDGDTYARAFDVVAHELTHAVTDAEVGLIYEHQPGALSESISDVMAAFAGCSPATGNTDCDWLMGETLGSGTLRDISNPPVEGDPDHWSLYKWLPLEVDNGNLHHNCGIPNKAAYLLTAGGTFHSVSVSGLGYTKTEQIYYRAFTNYLTTYSDFLGMRLALSEACEDLVGLHNISAGDCDEVEDAWDAVGVIPASAPPPAGPNRVYLPLVSSSICTASEILSNGSFESGTTSWTLTGNAALLSNLSWAHNGSKVVRLGYYNSADDKLYQTVNIPGGRTSLKISFRAGVYSTDSKVNYYDKLYASLQPVDSVSLPQVWTVDNTDSTSTPYWYLVTLTYNELPFTGQSMRLYLRGYTDGSLPTNFYVDSASVQVQCSRYPWLNEDQADEPVFVQIEPDPDQTPPLGAAGWSTLQAP